MEKTSFNRPLSMIEWGVAARALPGQRVSGDLHLIKPFTNGILIAVADGLGHGDEATAAAKVAINTLANHAHEPIPSLVHRCNESLASTRGVVMTLAALQLIDESITWVGIGNVECSLIRAETTKHPSENVLLRGGVLGYQTPTLQTRVVPIVRGDLLIFATDGIRTGFTDVVTHGDSPQQIADRIMERHFKGTDDALVLVVRYLGLRHD
ncbi:MAG: SpoIIE family protein phosphatase [Verrucomicrobiota bacterium]